MNETVPSPTSVLQRTPVSGKPRYQRENHGAELWISNGVLAPKDNDNISVTVAVWQASKQGHAEYQHFYIKKGRHQRKIAGSDLFPKLNFKSTFHQLSLAPDSHYIIVSHENGCLLKHCMASSEINKALQQHYTTTLSTSRS